MPTSSGVYFATIELQTSKLWWTHYPSSLNVQSKPKQH